MTRRPTNPEEPTMPGTGASTAVRLLTEARASLAHSTAADVLAMRLGETPALPAHLVATMRVGATVTVDGTIVQRTRPEVWDFHVPRRSARVVVSRGEEGDMYGSRGWTVVEVELGGDQVTLDETKGVQAALSSALIWAETRGGQ